MEATRSTRGMVIKIAVVWLFIFLLVSFLIASRSTVDNIRLSVIPGVPKAGQPVVATFIISNPSDEPSTAQYELYVNGRSLESGLTTIAPKNSAKFQYAYRDTLERGEQVNFLLHSVSDGASYNKMISLPAYPPQIMSSLVSLAAFSTSVMSSMVSMQYFNDTFGTTDGINTGIIFSIVLIVLLIILELTQAVTVSNRMGTLNRYRVGFANISAILFIIFLGMVFTKMVMILAT